MDFQVGDRVESLIGDGCVRPGDTGTICSLERDGIYIRIRWDRNVGGHSCGGRCERGHGHNLTEICFALLSDNLNREFPAYTESELMDLLYKQKG